MLLNEKLARQVLQFSTENCLNGSLAKVPKFHTNPYNFVACLPNPYKLSILGEELSNVVFLPFEYLSFSNQLKTINT